MDDETGEVVVQFHETDIVRVNISGDVKLTSGGFHTVRAASSTSGVSVRIRVTFHMTCRVRYRGYEWTSCVELGLPYMCMFLALRPLPES